MRSLGASERKRWKRSSSGYPATTLAAWIALERRSFSLTDRFDFIVTVNKGIDSPDFWVFSDHRRRKLASFAASRCRTTRVALGFFRRLADWRRRLKSL